MLKYSKIIPFSSSTNKNTFAWEHHSFIFSCTTFLWRPCFFVLFCSALWILVWWCCYFYVPYEYVCSHAVALVECMSHYYYYSYYYYYIYVSLIELRSQWYNCSCNTIIFLVQAVVFSVSQVLTVPILSCTNWHWYYIGATVEYLLYETMVRALLSWMVWYDVLSRTTVHPNGKLGMTHLWNQFCDLNFSSWGGNLILI